MPYIIDCGECRANIFRFGPPAIFAGDLVETDLALVGSDRPLKIFVVSAPEKYKAIYPFFWTLGMIKEIDSNAGPPRLLSGTDEEIIIKYCKIWAENDPRPII